MYLHRKTFVGNHYQHNQDKAGGLYKIVNPKGKEVDGINQSKISEIIEQVGYWRKANAIHKWFVDNIQDGVDDCHEYEVSREDLQKLLDTVNKVLESSNLVKAQVENGYSYKNGERIPNMQEGKTMKNTKVAEELLPTTEGFFFGGTNYDEWYYQDLINTKNILEDVLSMEAPEFDGFPQFYYQSSW